MSEWLLVPIILACIPLSWVAACEVSVWFGMRAFRDQDEASRRVIRSRLRRAFWDGVTSIGFRPMTPRRRCPCGRPIPVTSPPDAIECAEHDAPGRGR